MSIIVKLKNPDAVNKTRYPYFGIKGKKVVFFNKRDTGVVIQQDDFPGTDVVGCFSTCFLEEYYTPFYGTIEITKD